jgi:hypothetical protein
MLKSILCLLSLTPWYFCTTLYEDQAGRFDWHKKFIGTPTSIYTFNSGQELLAQTDLNIISSIDSKTSNVNWRFEAQPEEKIIGIEENNQLFLTSLKRSRNHIYAHSLKSGDLLWEQTTPLSEKGFSIYLEYPDIYHVQNQQTLSKGSIDSIKWNWALNLNKDQGSILKIATIKGVKENTLLLFTQLGNRLQLLIVKDSGVQYETSVANTIYTFKSDSPIDSCMFYDNEGKTDVLLFKSANELIITPINSLTPEPVEIRHKNNFSLYKMACPSVYYKGSIRQLLENISLIKTSSGGTVDVVTLNIDQHSDKLSCNLLVKDSCNLLVKDSMALDPQTSYLVEEGSIIAATNVLHNTLPKYGNIEKSFPTTKEEVIIITRDGSFHKASRGSSKQYKLIWTRDESLSKAEETLILEFPGNVDGLLITDNEIQHDKNSVSIFKAYSTRFNLHYNQFRRAFSSFMSSPLDTIIKFHPNLLFSATNKLLVFINNDGKISALNSQNSGEKIWDQYLDLPGKTPKLESAHIINFPKALKNTAPALVLRYSFKNATQKLFILDGWTGELLDKKKSDLSIIDIKTLPLNHPKLHCNLLALVDSNYRVHFYPPVQNEMFKELAHSDLIGHLYYSKVDDSSINGYRLVWDPKSQIMVSQPLWNINLPSGQKVYKYEINFGIDQTASPGKALGNRNVLYKHLRPNLISIITNSTGVGMSLLLVDAVDGSTILQVSHKDALSVDSLSAHQILYENILIYSYRTHNHIKFTVSELYEADNQANYDITSINRQIPSIFSSSFTFTHSITSIGFTKTSMGITSKEVLVSLSSNQIRAISKAQLDPRRPSHKLTAFEQEEGLTVYKPVIPVTRNYLLTYYLDVANIRQIKSKPTEYESTTLILANGQDIYFGLRHPSHLFDVLSEDFSKFSLLLTLLGLIVSILVVKPLIKTKNLKERWAI